MRNLFGLVGYFSFSRGYDLELEFSIMIVFWQDFILTDLINCQNL